MRLVTGDTDTVKVGGGTHSGRGMRLASIIIYKARPRHHRQGRPHRRAMLLEAPAAEIEFDDGRFAWKGTNRSHRSVRGRRGGARPRTTCPTSCAARSRRPATRPSMSPAIAYGCHVCEVEIDPETGVVEIVRYTTVDDVGRAVNPLIIHGQIHGGIAQGVGQALLEHCFYDAEQRPAARPARSWITRCRAPTTSRSSPPRSARCPRPRTRSASARPAKAAPRRRSPSSVNAIVDALAELRRHPYRDAGHAGAHLAGDQRHGAAVADAAVT